MIWFFALLFSLASVVTALAPAWLGRAGTARRGAGAAELREAGRLADAADSEAGGSLGMPPAPEVLPERRQRILDLNERVGLLVVRGEQVRSWRRSLPRLALYSGSTGAVLGVLSTWGEGRPGQPEPTGGWVALACLSVGAVASLVTRWRLSRMVAELDRERKVLRRDLARLDSRPASH